MAKVLAPHLIERDGEKSCSVCNKVFQVTAEVSLARAFAAHVCSGHKSVPKPSAESRKKLA
jgi:hypothetical protein